MNNIANITEILRKHPDNSATAALNEVIAAASDWLWASTEGIDIIFS